MNNNVITIRMSDEAILAYRFLQEKKINPAKYIRSGGEKMDLLNLKLPYIGEIIEFGTYHNLEINGWVCTFTTFRDKDVRFPYEKIIGIQWFHPKLQIYRTHEQMLQMILNL